MPDPNTILEAVKIIIDRMNNSFDSLEKDVHILKSMGVCMPTIPNKLDEIRKTINDVQN